MNRLYSSVVFIVLISWAMASCTKEGNTIPAVPGTTFNLSDKVLQIRAKLGNETRLDVQPDTEHGLKTTWTEGDAVIVCFKHNDEEMTVELKYKEETCKGGAYAFFEGKVDGVLEGHPGIKQSFEDPNNFCWAVVIPKGGKITYEGGRITVGGINQQDGTSSNLKNYDLLMADECKSSDGIILSFKHKQFVYLHLPFHTENIRNEKVEKIYFNFFPATSDKATADSPSTSDNTTADSPFISDLLIFPYAKKHEFVPTADNKPLPTGTEVNILAIDNPSPSLRFDENGNMDAYILVGSSQIIRNIRPHSHTDKD